MITHHFTAWENLKNEFTPSETIIYCLHNIESSIKILLPWMKLPTKINRPQQVTELKVKLQ